MRLSSVLCLKCPSDASVQQILESILNILRCLDIILLQQSCYDVSLALAHWLSFSSSHIFSSSCVISILPQFFRFLQTFFHRVFNTATIKVFSSVPDKLKKSFTVDNGKEFAAHKELTDATGMKVYFCDPYSPWQRGTNENTNGLLRQFFSKGTSFANISDDDLQHIVDLINNRPRKRLGFRTPLEVLYKFFR